MNYPKHKTLVASDLERLFDISNYDDAYQLDAAGWSSNLRFRHMVSNFTSWSRNTRRDTIVNLLISPVPKTDHDGSVWGKSARSSIWDRTVFDAYFDRQILDFDELEDALEACKEHDHRMETEAAPAPLGDELLWRSLDDLCRERGIYSPTEKVIFVDLHATDETLIEDFKAWLQKKRQQTGSDMLKRNYTERDFQEWAQFKVLAYIDLKILCSYLNKRMSLATIGDLLFPNEDVDRAERVRKVVQPLSQKLMNPAVIDALDVQAGHAEPESQNSIPE